MKTILSHGENFKTFWAHYYVHEDTDFIKQLAKLGYRLELSNQMRNINEYDYVLFSEATSVGREYYSLNNKLKIRLGQVKYFINLCLDESFKNGVKRFLSYFKKRIFHQPNPDVKSSNSYSPTNLYKQLITAGLKDRLAVIVFEVETHLPENSSPKMFSMFPLVFTANDFLVDNKRILKFCYPQPVRWPKINPVTFLKKKLLVNITSNKSMKHPLELYSVRNADIQYFSEKLPSDFDLYGFGWNEPKNIREKIFKSSVVYYKNYKGIARNVADIYPIYRFALCYDNAKIPGMIYERIFQCMRSDCVPIYIGAPNIKDYVDSEAFIDRRDFATQEDLKHYLTEMSKREYKIYREAIRSYLESSKFKQFLSTSFAETIVKGLERLV